MKRIIYLSVLVLLLCTNTALAKSKFEAGLLFGSYQPSLEKFKEARKIFFLELEKSPTYGCILSYRITPRWKARIQLDSSKFKALMVRQYDVNFETTTISVLSLFDLFTYKKCKIYGGAGLTDYQVKTWISGFKEYALFHRFGPPWGTVVLLGLTTFPKKPYQISGEIQYVTGSDGQIQYREKVPLEWDGFKILLNFAVKF